MLYVVRHGETPLNRRKLIGGQLNVGLTDLGKEGARETGRALGNIKFDAAYCSTLVRTELTLDCILGENAHPVPDIVHDPRIRERRMGLFEGETYTNEPPMTLRWRHDFDPTPYDLEPIPEMRKRVYEFFDEIKRKHAGQNVIVATHNGVIRFFRIWSGELEDREDLTDYGVHNAAVLTSPL